MQYDYTKKPWELNPFLTEAFLNEIDVVFQRTQLECLQDRLNRERGDSDYSFGHVARAWRIHAIRQLVEKNNLEIKIIYDRGNHFEFAIHGTVLKFYSGSLDNINPNVWKKTRTEETTQYQLNLFEGSSIPLVWRFVVETAPTTHAHIATYIIAFNEVGDRICTHKITNNTVPVVYDVTAKEKDAVVLPNAQFFKKTDKKNEKVVNDK